MNLTTRSVLVQRTKKRVFAEDVLTQNEAGYTEHEMCNFARFILLYDSGI
jgi:hypothetical protein